MALVAAFMTRPEVLLLDEVEDLCSRVGILRAGRLVEVAVLDDLRGITTTVLEATLDGPSRTSSAYPASSRSCPCTAGCGSR